MALIKIKNFTDADKFLNALSPRAKPWILGRDDWVFRGQADANWKLIPSTFRKDSWSKLTKLCDSPGKEQTVLSQYYLEIEVVWAFARMADRHGLIVPGYDGGWMDPLAVEYKFEEILDRIFEEGSGFPPLEWEPMFGMAQHYGVPTRLLDWSESSYIAAYFASSQATAGFQKNKRIGRKHLAVWALDTRRIEYISSERNGTVRVARAPWATNPNLQAQKGLFTVHREVFYDRRNSKNDSHIRLLNPWSLDKIVKRIIEDDARQDFGEVPPDIYETPAMILYRLPWKEANRCLALLHREGISGASVFPGFSGVVRSMYEFPWFP